MQMYLTLEQSGSLTGGKVTLAEKGLHNEVRPGFLERGGGGETTEKGHTRRGRSPRYSEPSPEKFEN
jgi:hypothetical protein